MLTVGQTQKYEAEGEKKNKQTMPVGAFSSVEFLNALTKGSECIDGELLISSSLYVSVCAPTETLKCNFGTIGEEPSLLPPVEKVLPIC